jgi:hypothetical protein
MPNKEQLEAMGPEAAKESLRAQREARGLAPHVGQSTTIITTTTTTDAAAGLASVAL